MIDIHCHILPGVDDGSDSIDTSLEMAALAAENGTRIVVATPHCNIPNEYTNYFDEFLKQRFRELQHAVAEEQIPLQIAFGMETFGTDNLPDLLRQGRVITLNNSRYLLVEFYFGDDPDRVQMVLEGLLGEGVTPVVAHPERYEYVRRDPELAEDWKEMGCLLQVNKGSIVGSFGRSVQDAVHYLIQQGLADAAASDAHSPFQRTPFMEDAYEMVCDLYSLQEAQRLFWENPACILQNKPTISGRRRRGSMNGGAPDYWR